MSVSLTEQNKRDLKALLASGRWHNESEIIRYGLHLVKQEAIRCDLAPMPKGRLARALARRSAREKAEDAAWEEASVKASRRILQEEVE